MNIGIEKIIQDIKDEKGVEPGQIDKWGGIDDIKVAMYCISYKSVDMALAVIDYLIENKRIKNNLGGFIFHSLFKKPAKDSLKLITHLLDKGLIPSDIDYKIALKNWSKNKNNQTLANIKHLITAAAFKQTDKKSLSDLATMAVDLENYEDAQKFIDSGGKIYKVATRIAKAVETYNKEKFEFLSKNLIWHKK